VTPVERLGHAVVLFAAQVGAMAARAAGGGSCPLEALVHVTVCHETYAATARAILDGQRPSRPRDGYLAAALARERSCPPGRLVARLLRAQAALEALAPRADAAGPRFAFDGDATARTWPAALALIERRVWQQLEEVTGGRDPGRARAAPAAGRSQVEPATSADG
jgi:hypothetical protein